MIAVCIGRPVPDYRCKALDLKAVFDDLGQEKAGLSGFSDGAYTGCYFALMLPEKVTKIIGMGAGI